MNFNMLIIAAKNFINKVERGEARSVRSYKEFKAAFAAESGTEGIILKEDLLQWAIERWKAEVKDRPLQNVHRRSLDDTWRQVVAYAGGNHRKLLGPTHDELVNCKSMESDNPCKRNVWTAR